MQVSLLTRAYVSSTTPLDSTTRLSTDRTSWRSGVSSPITSAQAQGAVSFFFSFPFLLSFYPFSFSFPSVSLVAFACVAVACRVPHAAQLDLHLSPNATRLAQTVPQKRVIVNQRLARQRISGCFAAATKSRSSHSTALSAQVLATNSEHGGSWRADTTQNEKRTNKERH